MVDLKTQIFGFLPKMGAFSNQTKKRWDFLPKLGLFDPNTTIWEKYLCTLHPKFRGFALEWEFRPKHFVLMIFALK